MAGCQWQVAFHPKCEAWADKLEPAAAEALKMRVLFAFDKERRAILLVGGDKSGDWAG